MVHEVTKVSKRSFDVLLFSSAALLFKELLCLIQDMHCDQNEVSRTNAQILLQNLFHHDLTKVIRIAVSYCIEGQMRDEPLQMLVEVIAKFFDLMELHTQGKVMTLQTDRLIRRKRQRDQQKLKTQKAEEIRLEAEFIEKDSGEDEDADYDPSQPRRPRPPTEE